MTKPPNLIRAEDYEAIPERSFSHPLNPRSLVHMRSLGDPAGLTRLGIHVMRVPPGSESFVYHAHYTEEEFLYILAGHAIVEIADEQYAVGPGDFVGFPTPSVGHHLRNPFEEEVVYLSGGERKETEVADFPRNNKRLVRVGMSFSLHSLEDDESLGPFEKVRVK